LKTIICPKGIATAVQRASAAEIHRRLERDMMKRPTECQENLRFRSSGNKPMCATESNMSGKSTVEDGKIDGDNISLSITVKM
jgi:hypothetical protein